MSGDTVDKIQQLIPEGWCGNGMVGHICNLEAGHAGMCSCGENKHFMWKCIAWNHWEIIEQALDRIGYDEWDIEMMADLKAGKFDNDIRQAMEEYADGNCSE